MTTQSEVQTQQITLGQVYQYGHISNGAVVVPLYVISAETVECDTYYSLKAITGGWTKASAEAIIADPARAKVEYNGETYYRISSGNFINSRSLKSLTTAEQALASLAVSLNRIMANMAADEYLWNYRIFVSEGIASPVLMIVEVEDGAATVKLNTGSGKPNTIPIPPGMVFTAENLADIMAPVFAVCKPENIGHCSVHCYEYETNPYSELPDIRRG